MIHRNLMLEKRRLYICLHQVKKFVWRTTTKSVELKKQTNSKLWTIIYPHNEGIVLYLVESVYKSIRERSNVQQKIGNEYK